VKPFMRPPVFIPKPAAPPEPPPTAPPPVPVPPKPPRPVKPKRAPLPADPALARVPTDALYAEIGRRRASKRIVFAGGNGGRPKVIRACPGCGAEMGTVELRRHVIRCPSAKLQPLRQSG
jgi:hypothetical protein